MYVFAIHNIINIKSRKFYDNNEMNFKSLLEVFSFIEEVSWIWFLYLIFQILHSCFLRFSVRLIDFTNICRCMQCSSIGRWSINKVHVAGEIKDFVTILKCQKHSSTKSPKMKSCNDQAILLTHTPIQLLNNMSIVIFHWQFYVFIRGCKDGD